MSWAELDEAGFKLRLSELELGAVNVVVQPGQWPLPRVDHLGLALDDDEFEEALARAERAELRVQEHGGRRTFVSTNAGYRLELHPPRDWIEELLEQGERLRLAASLDGVGSKLMLSRRAGRLRWAGMDVAAHCIDDVLCSGADPLFLLDYVAASRLDLEQVAELVEGAAEVCRAAGCMLIGGETAELPGVYRDEELDFAAVCVGIVDRNQLIDGSRAEPGDVVLGLPSSGLHTNGFSLVRAVLGDGDFDPHLLLAPHW